MCRGLDDIGGRSVMKRTARESNMRLKKFTNEPSRQYTLGTSEGSSSESNGSNSGIAPLSSEIMADLASVVNSNRSYSEASKLAGSIDAAPAAVTDGGGVAGGVGESHSGSDLISALVPGTAIFDGTLVAPLVEFGAEEVDEAALPLSDDSRTIFGNGIRTHLE